MKLKNGTLKPIYLRTKIAITKLSDYAATRCRPSRKTAKILEEVTGIKAVIWLYGPEKQIKGELNKATDANR